MRTALFLTCMATSSNAALGKVRLNAVAAEGGGGGGGLGGFSPSNRDEGGAEPPQSEKGQLRS